MAIRIQHPDHGYHNVFSQIDLEDHIKRGWSKVIEKTPEPVKEIEKAAELLPNVTSAVVVVPTYACDVCGKEYALKMHLATHKKKHKR